MTSDEAAQIKLLSLKACIFLNSYVLYTIEKITGKQQGKVRAKGYG
jgi:hypothetical protein